MKPRSRSSGEAGSIESSDNALLPTDNVGQQVIDGMASNVKRRDIMALLDSFALVLADDVDSSYTLTKSLEHAFSLDGPSTGFIDVSEFA